MPRFRCRACDGEYEDPQGDSAYFHACPPERVRALRVGEVVPPSAANAVLDGAGVVSGVREAIHSRRNENVRGGLDARASEPKARGAARQEI